MALVIGNAAYTGERPLRNPVNDATDMANTLRRLGFGVQVPSNLGRAQLNRAVEDFMRSAEGADLAYPLQDVQVLEQSLRRLNFEVQVVRNAEHLNIRLRSDKAQRMRK